MTGSATLVISRTVGATESTVASAVGPSSHGRP
jgi:hypothetical protein